MKVEILQDVRDGVVPYTVANFSELHDYVDANLYGGTEELLDQLGQQHQQTDDGQSAALAALCDIANPAMEIINKWIAASGIKDAIKSDILAGKPPAIARSKSMLKKFEQRVALLDIDKLIAVEGDEPALGWKFSLNQLLGGKLHEAALNQITKDILTIEHWRSIYAPYKGRERDLLANEAAMIKVYDPPINGHLIADGFHRLAAAKIAGLPAIAAKLAAAFLQE